VVLTAGVLAAGLVLGCGAPAGAVTTEAYIGPGPHAVSRVADAGQRATTVGVDGVTLRDDGTALAAAPDGLARLARTAHAAGARSELLVSNFSETLGDFSPETGTALLADPANRDRVARALARTAQRDGFDGVQIDLESLREQDRPGLVAFIDAVRTAVRERLGPRARTSIAVMASTDRAGYRDTGYDLREIARRVDRVVLMTYDQHGPWSGPGTIGASPWTRQVVRAAQSAGVPRGHIDLGVAGYGYVWGPAAVDRSLTVAHAARLAGDRARWSARDGEWSAMLADGRELHWSDARSYRARQDLARELSLHGLAMWSLDSMPLPEDRPRSR
jgi:spore germination protein